MAERADLEAVAAIAHVAPASCRIDGRVDECEATAWISAEFQPLSFGRAKKDRHRKRYLKAEHDDVRGIHRDAQVRLCAVAVHKPQAARWSGERGLKRRHVQVGQRTVGRKRFRYGACVFSQTVDIGQATCDVFRGQRVLDQPGGELAVGADQLDGRDDHVRADAQLSVHHARLIAGMAGIPDEGSGAVGCSPLDSGRLAPRLGAEDSMSR